MKILVSACLLGENCKYSGGNNYSEKAAAFVQGHEVIPVCPEVLGGLSVPRTPAEIVNGEVVTKGRRQCGCGISRRCGQSVGHCQRKRCGTRHPAAAQPQLRCCRSIRWNLHRQKDPRSGRICSPAAGKRHPRAGCRYFRQYRTILSADAASEKYKLLSKKRR